MPNGCTARTGTRLRLRACMHMWAHAPSPNTHRHEHTALHLSKAARCTQTACLPPPIPIRFHAKPAVRLLQVLFERLHRQRAEASASAALKALASARLRLRFLQVRPPLSTLMLLNPVCCVLCMCACVCACVCVWTMLWHCSVGSTMRASALARVNQHVQTHPMPTHARAHTLTKACLYACAQCACVRVARGPACGSKGRGGAAAREGRLGGWRGACSGE